MLEFSTPVVPLLLTVFTSILEVFLICIAGYLLARRGILDKSTQKKFNAVNVSLFTPCLLFSKVAFFLSPAKLRELWIIPLFFLVVTAVSMVVAFLLGWIFRLKRSQRSFAVAAAMFMNSNSLPIALMQSLVVTVHGLKWGKDDNKNAMVGRALTYLVLYSTLGMILRWSYGVRLLAQADDETPLTEEPDENTPLLSNAGALPPENTVGNRPPHIAIHKPDNTLRPGHGRRRSTFYRSFPNSPNVSRGNLSAIDSEPSSVSTIVSPGLSDADDSDLEGELPGVQPSSSRTFLLRIKRVIRRGWVLVNEFMTVPLWAALASLVVACIRPLQHALEDHLQPIKGAVTAAGDCSIPLTLIVLGAYFHTPKEDSRAKRRKRRGLSTPKSTSSLFKSVKAMFHKPEERETRGETKTVVIAVVSRMIITPALLLPFIALSAKYNFPDVFADPVFVLSNVLLISSPPALTLAQITQAASGDAFERLISRTIFWAYCIVTPPATIIYVVIGMLISKL